MGRIHELEPHIADLIAAGEVVERPASVVKELVENSVDAGAKRVAVEIRRGGLQYIRVTDDGDGIFPEDIPTAFLRHATSKVREARDLEKIETMGFRGEALASIAAVAKVRLLTRTRGAAEGAEYRIAGGAGGPVESAGCPEGTSIIVEELFYNTPARMKFLKRDMSEASRVAAVVSSAALAHPDIAFRFIREGETEFQTRGTGDPAAAVYDVLGSTFAAGLMPVKNSQDGVTVSGFISKPAFGRGNRTKQEFFVNGRPISSRLLSAALEQGYRNSMVQGRFPACVIYIELNPAAVDVNVHPAKSEVKFAFEREVFGAVYTAVRAAIDEGDVCSQIGSRAALKFDADTPGEQQTFGLGTGFVRTAHGSAAVRAPEKRESAPARSVGESARAEDVAAPRPEPPRPRHGENDRGFSFGAGEVHLIRPVTVEGPGEAPSEAESTAAPERAEDAPAFPHERRTETEAAEKENARNVATDPPRTVQTPPVHAAEEPAIPEWRILGEVFGTYILVEDAEELVFIDKHAAHERMIFDRLVAAGEKPMVQYLISPLALTFSREETETINENIGLIRGLGFEMEHIGGESFAVRALPGELERDDAQGTLEQIADDLAAHRKVDMLEQREELLRLISCKAAMKAGAVTSDAERRELVRHVMGYRDVKFCPHGRPVAAVLGRAELERRINRRV